MSVGVAVVAVAAAVILAVVLLTGNHGKSGSGNQAGQSNQNTLASTLPTYQGQRQRGVFLIQDGVDGRKIVEADQSCSLSKRLVSAIRLGIASGSDVK